MGDNKVITKDEIELLSRELFNKCIEVAIGEKIDEEKYYPEMNKEERYIETFSQLPNSDRIESSALIMSINPSSSDLDGKNNATNKSPAPCYLHYIPDELKNIDKLGPYKNIINSWNSGSKGKRLCYPGYFGRIYKLFEETSYYPLFASKFYNDSWIDDVKSNISHSDLLQSEDNEAIEFMESDAIRKFIVIIDLLPLKETDSKKVGVVLKNEVVKGMVVNLLKLKIQYLQPKLSLLLFKSIEKDLLQIVEDIFQNCDLINLDLDEIDKVKIDENSKFYLKSGFIRYMSRDNWNKIKEKVNYVLGKDFNELKQKWDYIE
jgi:hypothetical protein